MSLYWVGTGVSWWEIIGRSGVTIIISVISTISVSVTIVVSVMVIAVAIVVSIIVVIVAILIICFYISKRVYIVLSGFGCE